MEMGGLDPHEGCTAPGPALLCGGPVLAGPPQRGFALCSHGSSACLQRHRSITQYVLQKIPTPGVKIA